MANQTILIDGDMTYFLNISIGRWDKPYELVKEVA